MYIGPLGRALNSESPELSESHHSKCWRPPKVSVGLRPPVTCPAEGADTKGRRTYCKGTPRRTGLVSWVVVRSVDADHPGSNVNVRLRAVVARHDPTTTSSVARYGSWRCLPHQPSQNRSPRRTRRQRRCTHQLARWGHLHRLGSSALRATSSVPAQVAAT